MMNSARQIALSFGLLIGTSTGVALAGPIPYGPVPLGTTGTFSLTRVDGFKAGAGGEFTVYNVASLQGKPPAVVDNSAYSATPAAKNIVPAFPNSFQTFCLEMTENAGIGITNFFVVGSTAAAGGGGSSKDAHGAIGGRDQISRGTAWLYSQFAQGKLNVPKNSDPKPRGDYFFDDPKIPNPPRYAEAEMLQKAIWWLEEEASPDQSILETNPYYLKAIDVFKDKVGGAKADAAPGFLGVYVLNNFKTLSALNTYLATGNIYKTPTTERAQDFLWYDGETVPDGGTTAMLLGGALMALGALRRKRSV
jgi:hypothetical protein